MSDKLNKEIKKYCELNNIENIEEFTQNLLQQGFNIEKYGMGPIEKTEPKIIEKEVPVEKIVEVIKEVPVEKIVEVEVEVIKEVPVTNDEEIKKLLSKLEEIEVIMEKKDSKIAELKQQLEGDVNLNTIRNLEQKITNLETELELEQNRNIKRKKNEKPKHRQRKPGLGNIINWVSKDERENDDVWGEE